MDSYLTQRSQLSVYIRVALYSLLGAMTAYVNSSFLETSGLSQIGINITYILVSLFGFSLVWHLAIKKYSISAYSKIIIVFAVSILLATALLGFLSPGPVLIILSLFVFMGSESPMFFAFDEVLEHVTVNTQTALTRSHFLIAQNLCWIFSPIIGMSLIDHTDKLTSIYKVSFSLALVLLLYSVYVYRSIPTESHARTTKHSRFEKKTIPGLLSHFALYTFYSAMITILPIYLNSELGWSWLKIGSLFAVALTAFPIIQYPAGRLLNKFPREDTTIPIGLFLIGLALILFIEASAFAPFSLLILLFFFTRIGAGLVEVSNESFIFKRINSSHRTTIAVFRSMSPVSFFLVPVFWLAIKATSMAYFLQIIGWYMIVIACILAIYFIQHHKEVKD